MKIIFIMAVLFILFVLFILISIVGIIGMTLSLGEVTWLVFKSKVGLYLPIRKPEERGGDFNWRDEKRKMPDAKDTVFD